MVYPSRTLLLLPVLPVDLTSQRPIYTPVTTLQQQRASLNQGHTEVQTSLHYILICVVRFFMYIYFPHFLNIIFLLFSYIYFLIIQS